MQYTETHKSSVNHISYYETDTAFIE